MKRLSLCFAIAIAVVVVMVIDFPQYLTAWSNFNQVFILGVVGIVDQIMTYFGYHYPIVGTGKELIKAGFDHMLVFGECVLVGWFITWMFKHISVK